ncbi:MAG: pseudaminic acid biosynthesis-associated methylase [Lachnospiraceae bacterium]|jgi:pseudaminic acid biosynthesis-associated methylase|nr:pseudaminic acid biosynthesis-associated methylase [Lachnospiraceae bacterium]
MEYKTEQEVFWSGEFGNQYIERNECTKEMMASAVGFFAKILGRTGGIKSVIEFGSNIGNNLKAIKMLQPDVQAAAIEINHQAANHLRADKFFDSRLEVYEASILEYKPAKTYDMALICGVLIHINPDALQSVYEKLYASAEKYICISEYYNPVPVEVSYRGHEGRLFKRDFAGEFLDRYPDCRLVDYGFQYHRDPCFPKDDVTWFLLEKRGCARP